MMPSKLLAPLAATAIRHARDVALSDGAAPIPTWLLPELQRHFHPKLLDRVRWTKASGRLSLDTLVHKVRPNCGAITFDNVIVFLDAPSSRDSKIWIHELVHVQQFSALGVDEFARQYLERPGSIEAATRERTSQLLAGVSHGQPAETENTEVVPVFWTGC